MRRRGRSDAAEEPTTTQAPATTTEADDLVDCTAVPTGQTDFVVDAGGAEQDVRVYVPTTYEGTSELPLVLNFHGFGSNGEQQAALTGYEELAEDEDFIVVHPTAIPGSGDRRAWEVADVDDSAKDDVAFVDELLDLLITDYCVDENHVYATGMSGGGMFATTAGCDLEAERVQQSTDIIATTYTGCDDDASMVFYEVVDGGHAWPSSPLTESGSRFAEDLGEIQGYSTFEIDATADGWAFMYEHTLDD